VKKRIVSLLTILSLLCGMIPSDVLANDIKGSSVPEIMFFVSPDGSDSNSGSFRQPFETLERAKEEVSKYNRHMSSDIYVYLRGGTYWLDETLKFTERDSGSNGFQVKYAAFEDEVPVISGGKQIDGWQLHDSEKNIYKASGIDFDFRQLYVDGHKAIRAQTGVPGEYSTRIVGADRLDAQGVMPEWVTGSSTDGRVGDQATSGQIHIKNSDEGVMGLSEYGNIDDLSNPVEICVLTAWAENILRIDSLEKGSVNSTLKIMEPEAQRVFNRPHPNIDLYSHVHTREFAYHLENAYEFITDDNEWFLDKSAETLYYKAPAGKDMEQAEMIAPALETLLSVEGSLDAPVRDIQFHGLTFQHSNWTAPSQEGLVGGQAQQNVVSSIFRTNYVVVKRPPAGVCVSGAHNLRFEGNTFRNMGATAFDLHWGTKNTVFINNTVKDISGNGISVGKFAINDTDADYHELYNPEDVRDICTDDKILNNYVCWIGTDYEGAVAIGAGLPKNVMIADNTVAYVPYSGISVGFGWRNEPNAMSGNQILRNEIHHNSQIMCDAGAIYTLSRQPGSYCMGNYIHDVIEPAWKDYGNNAMYFDEGTQGYTIRNNVITGNQTWIGFNQTGSNTVDSNHVNPDNSNWEAQQIIKNAGVKEDYTETGTPQPAPSVPEKRGLKQAIDSAGRKVQAVYDTKSWNHLQQVLTNARDIYEKVSFTQEELDKVENDLKTAIAHLAYLASEPETFRVTFANGGGSGSLPGNITAKAGTRINLPDSTLSRSGFSFAGWSDGLRVYQAQAHFVMPKRDVLLTAQWQEVGARSFTVQFDTNGGTKIANQQIAEGGKVAKPADPAKKGYVFTGWKNGSSQYDFSSKVAGDLKLSAVWEKVKVAKAAILKISNKKNGRAQVKIKKIAKAEGYQIQYALDRKFKKGKKQVVTQSCIKIIKRLKKGKTYYFKVRSYKRDSLGYKVYGIYSKPKKIRMK
jgi:uncharacterized repeat protein (TIGR02543 family)